MVIKMVHTHTYTKSWKYITEVGDICCLNRSASIHFKICVTVFLLSRLAHKSATTTLQLQWSNGAALWPMTWKWMGTDIFQLNVTCVYCVCVTVLSFSCRQANNFCHRRETNSMESRKAFLWSLFGGAINLQIRSTCGMNGRHREYLVSVQHRSRNTHTFSYTLSTQI